MIENMPKTVSYLMALFAVMATMAQAADNVIVLPDGTTTVPVGVTAIARTARNFPGCTVGVSSASCLAANTAVSFLQIQNPVTNSVNVSCTFGAPAVLGGSNSVTLGPGQPAAWGPMTAGVPSGQLNCIAGGASTPLYVEWN